MDIGSSFLPSELISGFLWAQIENIEDIQLTRKKLWNKYHCSLKNWALQNAIQMPFVPEFATNNAHMFYIVTKNADQRIEILKKLRTNKILAVFHYLSLHKSPFYHAKHDGRELPFSDHYSDCLIRLPMFYELSELSMDKIINVLIS